MKKKMNDKKMGKKLIEKKAMKGSDMGVAKAGCATKMKKGKK